METEIRCPRDSCDGVMVIVKSNEVFLNIKYADGEIVVCGVYGTNQTEEYVCSVCSYYMEEYEVKELMGARQKPKLDREEYASRNGTNCPFCESKNIKQVGEMNLESKNFIQNMKCKSCNKEWEEVLQVISYNII